MAAPILYKIGEKNLYIKRLREKKKKIKLQATTGRKKHACESETPPPRANHKQFLIFSCHKRERDEPHH